MITYRTDTLLFVQPHIFQALAERWRNKSSTAKLPYYHALGNAYQFIPFRFKKVLSMTSPVLAYQLQELHKLGFDLSQH